MSSAYVSVDQSLLNWLSVDFANVECWFLWWLTIDFLPKLTFCSLGTLYLIFCIDFILQSIFAYFASKWRKRICLFLTVTIVIDSPTNVLAIILRLAIITINQLFPFPFLTLRVSNQWLSSPRSPSLLDPISQFPQSTFKTSSLIPFVWLVTLLFPLLSKFYLLCLLPLGLWILLVAITWHPTRPYFLNLNLRHTLLIFAQQMVPQCLVII